MQNTKKNTILRLLAVLPCLLLMYILQGMIFPRLPLFGSKPLLLPLVVVGAALFEGRVTGGAVGLAAGILCDLSFNEPTAVFTLLLTVTGLVVGWLGDTVLVKSFPSYLLCSLGALIFCAFIQVFALLFFENAPIPLLLNTGVLQTLVSLPFLIPTYYITRGMSRIR